MPPPYFRFGNKRLISTYTSSHFFFATCDQRACYRATFVWQVWSHLREAVECIGSRQISVKKITRKVLKSHHKINQINDSDEFALRYLLCEITWLWYSWEEKQGQGKDGGGGGDPAFPLLFHENPTSRTFVISIPNPVFLSGKIH